MKWFRSRHLLLIAFAAMLVAAASASTDWVRHAIAGSPVEAALYRAMALPGVTVLFPRPPAESVHEVDRLIGADKKNIALYSLRAQQKEQALNFAGAESDWKTFAAHSPNRTEGLTALADFYSRRHQPQAEFDALLQLIALPASASSEYTQPAQQASWTAAERALSLWQKQALPVERAEDLWRIWTARYPQQSSVYARAFQWELDHDRVDAATALRSRYATAFPQDTAASLKMAALLALHGRPADGQETALAVYDAAFQPLWPADLTSGYFDLLATTHAERRFLADAQARLQSNSDDINAMARIFLYRQRQQQREAALGTLESYRQSKTARRAAWTAEELNTCAQLAAGANAYVDAARYSFALAHAQGKLSDGREAHEEGVAQLIDALLSAPDQPIVLGSGNLSMYRDIATLDRGPGYWNGILSLWLNSDSPATEFDAEQAKAQSYFHRAKAAELLRLLDEDAAASPARPDLHRKLVDVYAAYGDDDAVLQEGRAFLLNFKSSPQRVSVALTMADAYARRNNTEAEFALYDSMLQELSAAVKNMPLSAASLSPATPQQPQPRVSEYDDVEPQSSTASKPAVFALDVAALTVSAPPQAVAYSQLLERYIGRLTATNQQPRALTLLRHELDRNPNDPRMYERLADFLQANNFADQTAELYRQAADKFQDNTWYDKLARLYLRLRRDGDYAALTRKVTDTFSGTELDRWFAQPAGREPRFAVQLNQYAHQRFPHDLVFTDNLLTAYRVRPTRDDAAWEALMRQVWWQSPQLTRQFFAWMSEHGTLDAEVDHLGDPATNPAAALELAEAHQWRSHFEEATPLFASLADTYPANEQIGTTASDLQRSLAWLDAAGPTQRIARSVAIERRLLLSHPADDARLARIGDILADHADGSAASLSASAQLWKCMPDTAPGDPGSYLQSATVFWDYFQYDDAMTQLQHARARFHEPDLYAYEAGAIAEGKGDEPLAVHEYVAAATHAPGEGSQARIRLLQLARRQQWAGTVDQATKQAANDSAGIAALELRVDILEALGRRSEAAPMLMAALPHKTHFEDAEAIAQYAQSRSFTDAYEAALNREIEVAQDPIQRLQLRYALAQSYEARADTSGAATLIEAIYAENPKRLGVVRSTVDFDLRVHQPDRATKVLLDAAASAYPALSQQLMAEAASRLNDAGNHTQARTVAAHLLEKDPSNVKYLALAIDTYIGDDAGRAQFFAQQMDTIRAASIPADERKSRTAQLRKTMLPALTQSRQYDQATDQYIALLSAYPEDAGLVNEAALYALRYGTQQQLLSFYAQTNKASPQDARFFIDRALTETAFGDPAAAVDSYNHVVAIRKDRIDVYTAKASLEESLQRFDEAAADNARLYQLTYHDPQWMVAAARVRARQGRNADAVAALQAAWLHGSQSTPHEFFQTAAQLQSWDLVDQAMPFARQGAAAAGDSLVLPDGRRILDEDAVTFARVLARGRLAQEAITTLRKAVSAAAASPSSPEILAEQVKSQGVLSVTDADWRKRLVEEHVQTSRARFAAALTAASAAAATYYTPEEKLAYAAVLTSERNTSPSADRDSLWTAAAHTAHLSELEATWRKEAFTATVAGGRISNDGLAAMPGYNSLQRLRMLFNELGQTLESAASTARPEARPSLLTAAAKAYGDGGDHSNQLRVLRATAASNTAPPDVYLRLLLEQDKAAFIAEAAMPNAARADAAVNYALQHAANDTAYAALEARSHRLPAVWGTSYRALAGLYLRDTSPASGAAFRSSLALDQTIEQRLQTKLDTRRQLAGRSWFYEAARYGTWRTLIPAEDAEETIAADLEAASTISNYTALADTYAEAGDAKSALAEVGHAVELQPCNASLHDTSGLLLWQLNRRQQAADAWKKGLLCLRDLQDAGPAPESFWIDFRAIAQHTSARGLFADTKPSMEQVLRPYIRRNGSYRAEELLRPAVKAAPNAQEGTAWLLSLTSSAASEGQLLKTIDSASWLSRESQEAIARRELAISNADSDSGYLHENAERRIMAILLQQHKDREALAFLQSLSLNERSTDDMLRSEAVLAGRMNTTANLLARYSSRPETAPSSPVLQAAAQALAKEGKLAPAIAFLAHDLRNAESRHAAVATQYLALAELQIRANDNAAATSTLQRMVRVSADPYSDGDSAAALLERNNRATEALPFLQTIAAAVPWMPEYRVRLAGALQKSGEDAVPGLVAVAKNPQADYAVRVRAAADLAGVHPAPSTELNSQELNLIATQHADAATAAQPMFVAARQVAAQYATTPEARERLLLQAIATDAENPQAAAIRIGLFRTYAATRQIDKARGTLNVLAESQGEGSIPSSDAKLSADIAGVYLATGDPTAAIQFFDRAVAQTSGTDADALRKRIADIRTRLRLDTVNATRRPLVRAAIDQRAIVRPRVSALSPGNWPDYEAQRHAPPPEDQP